MSLKDRIKELASEKGISLPTLESDLGFGNSTIVKWDKSVPNAEKLNKVAKYFGVTMEYLLDGVNPDSSKSYYTDEETAKIAQEILENKELRMLMDVSKDAKPERLMAYYNMIKELERQENGE